MIKFSIFKKILAVSLVALLSFSCSKKENDDDETVDNNEQFFKIVYVTQAARQVGATSWTRTQGIQRLKFDYGEDENNTSQGNFTFQYENYKETPPVLAFSNLCSGGYTGEFSLQEVSEDQGETCDTCPYDPQDPYDSGVDPVEGEEETDPDTGEPVEKNFYFIFTLSVQNRSFASGCSAVNPQDAFSLRVIRFPNGDLIVTNESRSLEFYLIPELVR